MHLTRTAMAAATIMAGALALTACNDNSGSSGAGSPTTPASGTAASSSAGTNGTSKGTGTATSGGTSTGQDGNGNGAPTTARGGAPGSGTAAGRCHTGDLAFSWASPGPGRDATQQQRASVVLRNTSGHTCAMHGFPGVDLVNSGTQWPLVRDSQSPATVTLAPGRSTRFTVTFLPWNATGNDPADDFAPTTVVITPPNETTSYDLPWRWGRVLRQDAATHPGTYTGPVGR